MLKKEKTVEPTSKSGNDAKPFVIRSVCECAVPYFPTGNIKWCSKCGKRTVY